VCRRDPLNAPVDEHGWCFHHGNLYAHNSTLSPLVCPLQFTGIFREQTNRELGRFVDARMRVQNNFAKMVLST